MFFSNVYILLTNYLKNNLQFARGPFKLIVTGKNGLKSVPYELNYYQEYSFRSKSIITVENERNRPLKN